MIPIHNKILSWILLSLVTGALFLSLGLYQPFRVLQQPAQVFELGGDVIILKTKTGWVLFSAPPDFTLPPHAQITLECNQGEWIPVLFDCVGIFEAPPSYGEAIDL